MKNTFGNSITITLFGESHGTAIGAVIDGLCPGLPVDTEEIARLLSRRRPSGADATARREPDEFSIVSGVCGGRATGTPLCILIPNVDRRSGDYNAMAGVARPAHADYAAYRKYHGYEDARGGGHFSGRLTAALVAAGGIFLPALAALGVSVGTHIKTCAGIADRGFADDPTADIASLAAASFPVLDAESGRSMEKAILAAKGDGDSVGGVTETAVAGMPAGVGEPWFDSVESMLSHILFSLGGVKGVEFGAGFALAEMRGSEANDPFAVRDGGIVTLTNKNGGINGGITNGMPMVFRCAVKPTPSISREQNTVNYINKEETVLSVPGRHDPAIVRRICPVIDAVTAAVLCDMLAARYGTDVFMRQRGEL